MESDRSLFILTAADKSYIPFLAAHLYSITKHSKQSLTLEITVLYRDITLAERNQLEILICEPHSLQWIEVNESLYRCLSSSGDLAGFLPNYFRLLAPYVFPRKDRVVWFDADTIITGDIEPLATMSLNGCLIGAVRDWLPRFCDAITNWREMGLDGNLPYFNSGVLVMNLKEWRKESIALRAYEICCHNRQYLRAQGKWDQHEQYGLNVSVQGMWHPLSTIWNHFTELPAGLERPKVLHYVGQGKPGSPRCQLEFTELFESILCKTPWAGWCQATRGKSGQAVKSRHTSDENLTL